MLENDDNCYLTTVSMSNNSSVTVGLNIPSSEDLSNYYFKVTQALTKNSSDGSIHLHSKALASDRSYNNISYTGDVINSFAVGTSTQLFNFDVTDSSLCLPVPNYIGNNNNVDFYLTNSTYQSTSVTNFEFQVAVFEKKV
jgi:hypothetical protein